MWDYLRKRGKTLVGGKFKASETEELKPWGAKIPKSLESFGANAETQAAEEIIYLLWKKQCRGGRTWDKVLQSRPLQKHVLCNRDLQEVLNNRAAQSHHSCGALLPGVPGEGPSWDLHGPEELGSNEMRSSLDQPTHSSLSRTLQLSTSAVFHSLGHASVTTTDNEEMTVNLSCYTNSTSKTKKK